MKMIIEIKNTNDIVSEWEQNEQEDEKKWIALSDEVKQAISLYNHLKNHVEVKESEEYTGMPMCKICEKSAYQIMCEEYEKFEDENDN